MRVVFIIWFLCCAISSQAYFDLAQFTAYCSYKQPKHNQLIDYHNFRSIKKVLRLHRTHKKQKKQVKQSSKQNTLQSSITVRAQNLECTSSAAINDRQFATLEHHLKNNNDTYNRQERLNALHQTRCTGGQRTKCIIAVDEKIYAYAREYEIPESAFVSRAMNEYEYQLHKEFVEQLTQAHQLKPWYNHALEHTVFLDMVGHSVAFGMQANQNNHTATATYWCDIAWKSLDLASAVGEGIALGAYNTAAFVGNVIRHPVETIQAVGHGVASVVTMLAHATGTVLKWQALEERGRHEQLDAEIDDLVDQINGVIDRCSDQIAQMPLREKVKHITALVIGNQMEYVKLENENGCYGYKGSTSIKMDIIGFFLSDDVGCYSPTFREWATKEHWKGASGNITMVEKEGDFMYLTDLYSEEEIPTELKMSVQQFVQLLDDWRDKVCAKKPKEVMIKYDNDQFIIETQV